MRTAVILLWAGCLWSIVRSVLWLVLTTNPWKRLLVLALLSLALSSCRSPKQRSENQP